ncbi:kinesin-like protein KIN-7A isoform X1 [Phragmites australis]|uniref:kinesin-like protein KIN-7A isoform X1 n=1 Tax=Phragmites australis TaxID=29695 RepID=UPI002D798932|nr:kinesin-like protein KIN-7A isoform X1 [Phragmites australis]
MGASRPPTTPASKAERTPMSTPTPGGSSRAKEEKIFVTVRLRPLSKKELAVKDEVAWECADSQTILYKGPPQDRAAPTSYTFDKVFGPACQADVVYEDGAKDVAMSALTGINATIFAYGQTSSGKTFTMRGVTESAVNDLYRHIANTPEREFVIKISAMEIYNEIVKDLLRPDSAPLRLLDDPEKGTIVEKLQEEIAKDSQHLRHLISICEEQRQVGETALNDTSSRSHQIIRLTLDSRLREVSGCVKSFVASLVSILSYFWNWYAEFRYLNNCLLCSQNFVDLAGSERAAQTHAIGARLKEGCHINRSLLTLTTVIRKLSSEKRSGHIPYRDSKLTRILQLSLGGNARTAIICTMSPALTHVEQSRNTLFFATCAKEVTNTAKVNMVVSDKHLVKHLQTEVARLEAELRTPDRTSSSDVLIMEKDRKIRQLEFEIEELKKQRDNAQSQVEELRKNTGDNQLGWNPFDSPQKARKCLTFSVSLEPSNKIKLSSSIRQSSTAPFMLKHEIRKLEQLQQQLEVEANRAIEVLHKEVECHKHGNQDAAETIAKLQAEIREMKAVRSENRDVEMITDEGNGSDLKDEISRLYMQDNDIAKLEAKLEKVQRSIDRLVMSLPNVSMPCNETTPKSNRSKKKRMLLPLGVSNNINRADLLRAPCSPHSSSRPSESEFENRAPEGDTVSHEGSEKAIPTKNENGDISSRDETPRYRRSSSVNMKKMQRMFQNAAEENVRSIRAYVTELKERVAKLQYQKQLLVCQVLELESNEGKPNDGLEEENAGPLQDSPDSWDRLFKEQMQHIIQLWDLCHVSIIHRTQFYLLFRGDRADRIYIEVEVRRLAWLQQHFAEVGDASPAAGDDPAISLTSSIKVLRNEREFLARRMGSRLTDEERECLFIKWQVPLDAKQRKLQLANKLWTDPNDQVHVEESADLVARLVGFCEGGNISKEMFELNFAVPTSRKPWLVGWQPISTMIREKTLLW